MNHVAFFVPERSDVHRAAEFLLESGLKLEYGPSVHGIGEQCFLYFREPGGMRIELNASGYRNYVPDWKPVRWTPAQGSASMYRNSSMPDSMAESFPPAPAGSFPEPAAMDDIERTESTVGAQPFNPYREPGNG